MTEKTQKTERLTKELRPADLTPIQELAKELAKDRFRHEVNDIILRWRRGRQAGGGKLKKGFGRGELNEIVKDRLGNKPGMTSAAIANYIRKKLAREIDTDISGLAHRCRLTKAWKDGHPKKK